MANAPIDETGIYPPSVAIIAKPITHALNLFHEFWTHLVHNANAPTDKLPVLLKNKLAEIQKACTGFKVVSTDCGPGRHSYFVAGTSRPSLHCANKAADFVVRSYECARKLLVNWRGGQSVDPEVVHHIHLSIGGREDGVRFRHGGGGHRYAHRHGRVAALSPFARVA